jgi:hypothetical protein
MPSQAGAVIPGKGRNCPGKALFGQNDDVATIALAFAARGNALLLGDAHVHDTAVVGRHGIEIHGLAALFGFGHHALGEILESLDVALAVVPHIDDDRLAALGAISPHHLVEEMLECVNDLASATDEALGVLILVALDFD